MGRSKIALLVFLSYLTVAFCRNWDSGSVETEIPGQFCLLVEESLFGNPRPLGFHSLFDQKVNGLSQGFLMKAQLTSLRLPAPVAERELQNSVIPKCPTGSDLLLQNIWRPSFSKHHQNPRKGNWSQDPSTINCSVGKADSERAQELERTRPRLMHTDLFTLQKVLIWSGQCLPVLLKFEFSWCLKVWSLLKFCLTPWSLKKIKNSCAIWSPCTLPAGKAHGPGAGSGWPWFCSQAAGEQCSLEMSKQETLEVKSLNERKN